MKQMNTDIENRKKEIKGKVSNMLDTLKKESQIILAVCTFWEISDANVNTYSASIKLRLKVNKDKEMKICYNKPVDPVLAESFRTEIESFSSFDLLKENDYTDYFLAVADIAQHKNTLNKLRDLMASAIESYNSYLEEYLSLK